MTPRALDLLVLRRESRDVLCRGSIPLYRDSTEI